MWKCRICTKEYVNDGPELSLKDRKIIKDTGSKLLIDVLVKWSSINVADALPFCPSCIRSVKRISSLSKVCDSIKNEVYKIAAEFMLHSGKSRKSLGGGLQLKSRCSSCYMVCSEMKSAQEMVQHNKIMTTCKKYLHRLLNNDVFEPFCAKCYMRVNQIVELDQKWEQADANMRKCADEFSFGCLMPPTSKSTTSDETLNILKEDSIIPEVEECSIVSIGPKYFVDIDNVAGRRQSIENDYSGNEILPTVNVNSLINPGTSKTNFTAENVEISDSPAASDHPYENTGSATSSDVEDFESQMTRNFFSPDMTDMSRFDMITSQQKDLPIASPHILPQAAFGTVSSSNNEVTSRPVPSINLVRLDANLYSSSLNNLSSNSDMPSLNRSPKVNLQPLGHTCDSCSKVYKYKVPFLKHKYVCRNSLMTPQMRTWMPALKKQTGLDEMTDEDDDDSDYDDYRITGNWKRKGQLRKKLRNSSKPYNSNCKFCPAKATSGPAQFQHNQTHYDEAVDTRCEICKLVYSSKSKLDSHMTERHN